MGSSMLYSTAVPMSKRWVNNLVGVFTLHQAVQLWRVDLKIAPILFMVNKER